MPPVQARIAIASPEPRNGLPLGGNPNNDEEPTLNTTRVPLVTVNADPSPTVRPEKSFDVDRAERELNLLLMSGSVYSSDLTTTYKLALPRALKLYIENPFPEEAKRVQNIALLAGRHDIYLIFEGRKSTVALAKEFLIQANTEAGRVELAEEVRKREATPRVIAPYSPIKEEPDFKHTLALAQKVSSGSEVTRMDLIHAISELNLTGPQYNSAANSLADFIPREDRIIKLTPDDLIPVLKVIKPSTQS